MLKIIFEHCYFSCRCYNPIKATHQTEEDLIMETTSTLQYLRETVSALAEKCTDESLLDLICKLLLPPEVGRG